MARESRPRPPPVAARADNARSDGERSTRRLGAADGDDVPLPGGASVPDAELGTRCRHRAPQMGLQPRRRRVGRRTTTTTTTTTFQSGGGTRRDPAALCWCGSCRASDGPLTSWAVRGTLPELQISMGGGRRAASSVWRSRDATRRGRRSTCRSAFKEDMRCCRSTELLAALAIVRKRPIARDAHDAHPRERLALPTAERMAAEEAALSAAAIRAKNKSPQKDPGERPKSPRFNGEWERGQRPPLIRHRTARGQPLGARGRPSPPPPIASTAAAVHGGRRRRGQRRRGGGGSPPAPAPAGGAARGGRCRRRRRDDGDGMSARARDVGPRRAQHRLGLRRRHRPSGCAARPAPRLRPSLRSPPPLPLLPRTPLCRCACARSALRQSTMHAPVQAARPRPLGALRPAPRRSSGVRKGAAGLETRSSASRRFSSSSRGPLAAQAQAAQQAAQQYGYVPKPLPKKPRAMNGAVGGGRGGRGRGARLQALRRAGGAPHHALNSAAAAAAADAAAAEAADFDEYGGGGAYASEPPLRRMRRRRCRRRGPTRGGMPGGARSSGRCHRSRRRCATSRGGRGRSAHLHQQSRKKRRLWGLFCSASSVESGR